MVNLSFFNQNTRKDSCDWGLLSILVKKWRLRFQAESSSAFLQGDDAESILVLLESGCPRALAVAIGAIERLLTPFEAFDKAAAAATSSKEVVKHLSAKKGASRALVELLERAFFEPASDDDDSETSCELSDSELDSPGTPGGVPRPGAAAERDSPAHPAEPRESGHDLELGETDTRPRESPAHSTEPQELGHERELAEAETRHRESPAELRVPGHEREHGETGNPDSPRESPSPPAESRGPGDVPSGSDARRLESPEPSEAESLPAARAGDIETYKRRCIAALACLADHGPPSVVEAAVGGLVWHAEFKGGAARIREEGGIIRILVQVLGRGSPLAKERAVMAVGRLIGSDNPATRVALVAAGALEPLADLLEVGTPPAREMACLILCSIVLSQSEEVPDILGSEAAVGKRLIGPILLLLSKECPADVKESAGGVLYNIMIGCGSASVRVYAPLALAPTLAQLEHGTPTARDDARVIISYIVNEMVAEKKVVPEGLLHPLVRLIKSGAPDVAAAAARQIPKLAGVAANRELIVEAGALGPLTRFLGGAGKALQPQPAAAALPTAADAPLAASAALPAAAELKIYAAAALFWLGQGSDAIRASIVTAGAVAPLTCILGEESLEAQQIAAGALQSLSLDGANQKEMMDHGVLSFLKGVLVTGTPEAKGHAAGILGNLLQSSEYKV